MVQSWNLISNHAQLSVIVRILTIAISGAVLKSLQNRFPGHRKRREKRAAGDATDEVFRTG